MLPSRISEFDIALSPDEPRVPHIRRRVLMQCIRNVGHLGHKSYPLMTGSLRKW
jgi:hypothetical protein